MTPAERSKEWRKNNRDKHRQYSRDYYAAHPEQVKEKVKEWIKDNPEKRKATYTKSSKKHPEAKKINHLRRYSLTLEQYNNLLIQQSGLCKICGCRPNGKGLHIDHDHATGKVRGLLCINCNLGLGGFRDDTRNLRLAISYLEKNG